MKPVLIDLFCGAGGCSVGYHRAGFDVIGVDLEPHPDYPFFFIQGDALEVLAGMKLDKVAAIAASPPCPRYSTATPVANREKHPDLVPPVREALRATGLPYVIENVVGAPLIDPVRYCGSSFGLRVRRHRLFESNMELSAPACDHGAQGQAVGVYGAHADRPGGWLRPNGKSRGIKATSVEDAQDAMGIDWMTKWHDLADAIPPAYTEHIGRQLLAHLQYDTEGRAMRHTDSYCLTHCRAGVRVSQCGCTCDHSVRQCEMENDWAQQCLRDAVPGSDYCGEHEAAS